MRERRLAPWALFAGVLLLVVVAHALALSGDGGRYGYWREGTAVSPTFAFLGALILSRRPGNTIGRIFLAIGLLGGLQLLSGQYATTALAADGVALPGGPLAAWFSATAQHAVVLCAVALIMLFPTGRLPGRRWRPLTWLAVAGPVVGFVSATVLPGPLQDFERARNPFGLEGADAFLQLLQTVGNWGALLFVGLAVAALLTRFYRSRGEERQQLKWFAYAASLGVLAIFFGGEDNAFGEIVWTIGPLGLPVAATVAILRYRLYDIDRIINRTLVYAALCAVLASTYLVGVAGSQYVLRTLTGQEQQPQLAVVVSTLVIAALFNPLRRRLQFLVDRRFYRHKYDARRTLEDFGLTLREETDLDALAVALLAAVRNTVAPAHTSLWLQGKGRVR